ncbi:aspartyl protease family protein [Pontibacter harenae]|uniref:aspartyl protease family protein n=1 Tax=Pontibacter harenae TaxID=2894083 RepID=UPI001E6161E2|nr:aspartyl protease family protein [Pontibacter harenae]MCC9167105.1 aspartyl protease family protein [Pontibacter harenae]
MSGASTKILLCFFLFFALTATGVGQIPANGVASEADTVYFVHTKKKKVKIPFQLVHNLIIIPVSINNSPPLNFILDSGIQNTLITQLYYTDSLNLQNANKVVLNGLGTGNEICALYSKGNMMHMNGIEGINHQVYVLLEDVFDLSFRMGMPVHGIIGYDIFKNFIVKVNYSTKIITLYKPDTKLKFNKKAEVHPLHIEGKKGYIYAKVKQHNGDTVNVKLVVDTGASHSLSLYLPSNSKLQLPPVSLDAYLGRGLSGDIKGKIGRLSSFIIGKYAIKDMPTSYPEEDAIKRAMVISNRNGNIGSDIFKRFDVVFDFPHNQIILKPGRKFKDPYYHNLAGFEVNTPIPGSNIYVVSHVLEGTQAKQIGLLPGDQLLWINGKNCLEMKLTEVLDLLQSKPGRKLRMKLQRNSIPFAVDLVLQSGI